MMMMMMMMMMMNCFCGMVDRRKAFSLISSRDHCQRSSRSRIFDTSEKTRLKSILFSALLFYLPGETFASVNKPNKTALMAVSQPKLGQKWIQ